MDIEAQTERRPASDTTHDIIVIGGSMGAKTVLEQMFRGFPAELPASIFVVTHIPSHGPNLLAPILDTAGPLRVGLAQDGEPIQQGRAYVAPAGTHLLLDRGFVRLGRGPRENMARPAVDPLFRSAAVSYGPRVIGLILSGLLDDGAAGLAAIKRGGGITVVQDPADAIASEMPLSALVACDVDYRVPGAKLANALVEMAAQPAAAAGPALADIEWEVGIARGRPSTAADLTQVATPVPLSCPSCGGVLSQMFEPSRLRFRCQIGHGYTAEVLDKEQEAAVAESVGVAIRVLEERYTLLTKMSADARGRGFERSALSFDERAAEFRRQADQLRTTLYGTGQ